MMGYIRNHAIVVETYDGKIMEKAHKKAQEIFPYVSPVSPLAINGSMSFFVPPDGSKEGWEDSDIGDERRKEFLDWCDSQAYHDGSNCIKYVELFFGDDNGKSMVERHN